MVIGWPTVAKKIPLDQAGFSKSKNINYSLMTLKVLLAESELALTR